MARLLRWGLAASILWVSDAFLRQTVPPRRTTLARPLNARLAGGQDPPFTFGGDGGAGGVDRQAATQTQPALPNSAAQPDAKSLPFRLEKFMDGCVAPRLLLWPNGRQSLIRIRSPCLTPPPTPTTGGRSCRRWGRSRTCRATTTSTS
jgi:hypothetical protein